MFCTNCGQKRAAGDGFCTQCGTAFVATHSSGLETTDAPKSTPQKTTQSPETEQAPSYQLPKEVLDDKTSLGRFLLMTELADNEQLPKDEQLIAGQITKREVEAEKSDGLKLYVLLLAVITAVIIWFLFSVVGQTQRSDSGEPLVRNTLSDSAIESSVTDERIARLIGSDMSNSLACSISYSNWSQCNWDSTQTRFVTSIGPRSCSGGETLADTYTRRACNYTRNPELEILKSAMLQGEDNGLASVVAKVSNDIQQKHNGQFAYTYISENPLPLAQSLNADYIVHLYTIRISNNGSLEINYTLRTTNNAEPDLSDVILYDTDADGLGDAAIIQKDPFQNVRLAEEYEIRGLWISIINQYVLLYL